MYISSILYKYSIHWKYIKSTLTYFKSNDRFYTYFSVIKKTEQQHINIGNSYKLLEENEL